MQKNTFVYLCSERQTSRASRRFSAKSIHNRNSLFSENRANMLMKRLKFKGKIKHHKVSGTSEKSVVQ